MEKNDLLDLLEGLSPEKISLLRKELSGKKASRPVLHKEKNGSVKEEKNVEVHILCKTCGSITIVKRKGDDVPIDAVPSIKIGVGGAKVWNKSASSCPYCIDFIKTLSRGRVRREIPQTLEAYSLYTRLKDLIQKKIERGGGKIMTIITEIHPDDAFYHAKERYENKVVQDIDLDIWGKYSRKKSVIGYQYGRALVDGDMLYFHAIKTINVLV